MKKEITDIWRKVEKSKDYMLLKAIATKSETYWNMYLDEQWKGVETGGEELPFFNIIKPTIKYKTNVVCQNTMVATFSDMSGDESLKSVCELLNQHFVHVWEKGKMDVNSRQVIKNAAIVGDGYLFFGEADTTKPQIIENTCVLLADEQEPNLQEQEYICLLERLSVSEIKKQAKENGISKAEIDLIVSDEDTEQQLLNKTEVKTDGGKCSSVIYMTKKDGYVNIARSTKHCLWEKLEPLRARDSSGEYISAGVRSYPLLNYIWEKIPNNARGNSEVKGMLANQREINKTLARMSLSVKQCAFPKMAYDELKVANPDDLDKVGGKIKMKDTNAASISQMIAYLNPTSMSNDAPKLLESLMSNTRELVGAGDSATGNIDPTQASGTAIIAVRDQNVLPLNEQAATYKQFTEDYGLICFDLWTAYNPDGLEVTVEEEVDLEDVEGNKVLDLKGKPIVEMKEIKKVIPLADLERMKIDIKVDVSPDNPISKYSQQSALDAILGARHITFEEYVDALDPNGSVPKATLQSILDKREVPESSPDVQIDMGGGIVPEGEGVMPDVM